MFFPGTLAVDPLGDLLYVANTNADLSFGGSTLFAVDLLRHERAVACFRRYGAGAFQSSAPLPDIPECGAVSCSDSGAALGSTATIEQTERHEAMSQLPPAQFDRCYCQRDVDDPNIVNCEPQRFILADQTTKLGFFPGQMKILAEDPPLWQRAADDHTLLHRAIYMTVRGDPSVTFIDATRPLLLGRHATDSPRLDLNCSGVPRVGDQETVSRAIGAPYVLKECAAQNRAQRTADDILLDMNNPNLGTVPRFLLPTEPLGITIDRGCIEPGAIHERGTFYGPSQNPSPTCYSRDTMGNQVPGTYYQYLVTSHLPTSQISAFNLPGTPSSPMTPVLQDVSGPLFTSSNAGRSAFAIAPRVPGDLSQPWYVTSRVTGTISTFRLATAAGPKVVPGLLFDISRQFNPLLTNDVRDMVFEPGSSRAFIAVYTPPSLVVLDTRLRSANSGVPNNQVTSIVNLCSGPSRLAFTQVPRLNMGTPTLATRIYATCYLSGQLAEVDADSGELTSFMQVGRGPVDIALNFGATAGIDPCADPYVSDGEAKLRNVTCPVSQPDLRPRPLASDSRQIPPRAYISSYLDSAVAVVDLDPSSPTFRRTVSRIGLPSPKKVE